MPEFYHLTPEQRATLALPAGSPEAPRDYWAALASEGQVERVILPGDAPLGYAEPVIVRQGNRYIAQVRPAGTPEERQSAARAQWRASAVISPFQARTALADAGLLAQVEALMADPATPEMAKLAWQYAQEFRRTSPTLQALAEALGLDEAALDALFQSGEGITA